MSRYKISVSSGFKELWRYNITAVCELCSADGKRIDYKAEESFVAPVGSNLKTEPIGYSIARKIELESGEGDYVNILVYIIPNSLPTTDDIYQTKPFPLIVKVECDGKSIINRSFEINQWSGDNISLERVGATDYKEE